MNNMTAQEPAEGIMKTNDFGDCIFYTIACQCGDTDDAIRIEVEAEEAEGEEGRVDPQSCERGSAESPRESGVYQGEQRIRGEGHDCGQGQFGDVGVERGGARREKRGRRRRES